MTDMTPAQRLAAGHQAAELTDTERRRLASIASTHNPDALAALEQADTGLTAAGQTLSPSMRTALGYARNAADATQTINQHEQ